MLSTKHRLGQLISSSRLLSSITQPETTMSTVIIGGGVIGLSTAYYLSLQQPGKASSGQIHVVDNAPSLLLSASGYAGGFLAKDWFSPAVSSLGALSFRLHRELADEHDGERKWGYAASTAYSLAVDEYGVGGKKTGKKISGKDWLLEGTSRAHVSVKEEAVDVKGKGEGADRDEMLNDDGTPAWISKQDGGSLEIISSGDGCAQVEPRHLSEWLQQQCGQRGVRFHLDSKPLFVRKDEKGRINGLAVQQQGETVDLDARNIILTAGAWTPKLFQTLFPQSKTRVGISPLAGYSIVIRSPRYSRPLVNPDKHESATGMCHSVFCGPGPNWKFAPEALSRMTKEGKPEVYVAGLNDSSMSLPEDASTAKAGMNKDRMRDLRRATVYLTGLSKEADDLIEDDLEIVREGLCFRPVSDTGRPIVTKVTKKQLGPGTDIQDGGGVYIAAGHGPWGISLGLGTGLVVAEMLQGKKTSAKVEALGMR